MSATPQDVENKIAAAMTALLQTTTPGAKWLSQHGSDWKTWPTTSKWFIAYAALAAAQTEAGQLVAPQAPTAEFSYKGA